MGRVVGRDVGRVVGRVRLAAGKEEHMFWESVLGVLMQWGAHRKGLTHLAPRLA